MVGGFQFIQGVDRRPAKPGPAIGLGLLAALVVALLGSSAPEAPAQTEAAPRLGRPAVTAPPAAAPNRSPAPSTAPAPVVPAEGQVSMSATAAPPSSTPGDRRRPHDVPDDFPLTRAAARQRIESMSPTGWLAHYGPVSIERHE